MDQHARRDSSAPDPPCEGDARSGAPAPPGDRAPAGAASPIVTLLPGDGGVIDRVRRRTALAAGAGAAAAALLAVTGWFWPGFLRGVAGLLIGGLAVLGLAAAAWIYARRAAGWSRAADAVARLAGDPAAPRSGAGLPAGEPAVCGDPVPWRTARPRGPVLRRVPRLPAHVLPMRTAHGPLSSGRAAIVHGRRDGHLPRSGDGIEVHALGMRGPYLLVRPADGAIFVADCWPLSTV